MTSRDELSALLAPYGQEHVLQFWEQLDAAGRESLAAQIRQIDLPLLGQLYAHRTDQQNFRQLADRAGPPAAFRLDPSKNRFSPEQAQDCGNRALDAGQVGVIVVAGGQGTRLGFDHPKGMYPIGPVSGQSLFEIHCEKILALGQRHGVRIPLYLMTSPATHDETVEYFAKNDRFGLAADDLHIFCQGTMPAVDAATGKLLLASPERLATSPNGHGGMLAAFVQNGPMDDARRRGIRELFYFQVDNPLVEIGGAKYIGYHRLSESEMTSQVIAKRFPLDAVGNVVEVDGRLMVIEYSDLPEDIASRRNPDGSLAIWAGSIAVHIFDVAFLERMAGTAEALPFHVANKKVAYVDDAGQRIEPQKPNAIKFERFIFDLMPSAKNAIVIEVDAAKEFAPLKNASGAKCDTPKCPRASRSKSVRSWHWMPPNWPPRWFTIR